MGFVLAVVAVALVRAAWDFFGHGAWIAGTACALGAAFLLKWIWNIRTAADEPTPSDGRAATS